MWALSRGLAGNWGLGVGLLATGLAAAQGSGWTPTFGASTSYNDARGREVGAADRQFITQISPGLRWASRQGRIQGSVDYKLNARFYSKQDEADDRQNALSAVIKAEAIEDWLFVEGLASIGQEALSPFDRPVGGSLGANPNATEVRNYSLSPFVRGRAFGTAVYEARWTTARMRGARNLASNSDTDTSLVSLASASGGRLGWGVQATRQKLDFGSGANSTSDRVNAQLDAALNPELRLGLTAGREATDVVGGGSRSYNNWGWTARWTPTPRTDLTVASERRYFGNAHNLRFTHRMRRSTWVYTDTRGASSGGSGLGSGQPVSLYSLYFSLFEAQEPDPGLRDQLVRAFLQANGLDPAALASGGFLTSAVTLQRRQDLAFAIQGVRTSISLQAFRGETRALQTSTAPQTPTDVRQSGYTASLSYRLTPTSSISLLGTRQRTAASATQPESDQQTTSLSWSASLGRHVSTSLALRHTDFESLSNPYREAAAIASLNVRF